MKILVLSDSHASLQFMRRCVQVMKPDAVIHLGDYYDDGQVIAEENPNLRVHQVPGNCDRFRCPPDTPQVMCYSIGGVRMFMTHGHLQSVKLQRDSLIFQARQKSAQIALYGHTHEADCHRETDGMWVLNPGSCGTGARTAGWIETEENAIKVCRILSWSDLEETKWF